MATEMDTGLPSVRQIQSLIRDKRNVEVKLMTGDIITGQMVWQDVTCCCLATSDGARFQIWYHAIAFLKPL